MSNVTQILSKIESGDPSAAEQLLPLIYNELRNLAAAKLGREREQRSLVATALVHEAYLRLVGSADQQHWNGRGHFFAAAAEAMRRILIEQARHRKSAKAGGRLSRRDLADYGIEAPNRGVDLLALDEALVKLEVLDARKAQLVKLRYFAGLTIRQAAEALGISESTANADWAYAKTWLRLEIDR